EQTLQAALTAVLAAGINEKGLPNYSLRSAALDYKVSRTTLTARYNGRQTRLEAHAKEQKLTPSQENVLKEWIKALGRRGLP
ncbi:hypothetical protein P692DRAFT_20657765, partial [Suillus brevipes Sb2]